jgi:anaerobic selenocysteine-containing dehydrogenase
LRLACVATQPGKRRGLIAPATAAQFGLADGGLIEIVARGPSLRAWIEVSDLAGPGTLGLDAEGLVLLGAGELDAVALRRI